jgi:uncharacterized protein DUF3307
MTALTALGILLAHVAGDYVVQTHWMATEKLNRWLPAAIHALTYTACYLAVTRSLWALLVIGGTHYLIDRYRLARYLIWFKNYLAPAGFRFPLSETINGYPIGTPIWLATGLLIVVDNWMHLVINTLAVLYL